MRVHELNASELHRLGMRMTLTDEWKTVAHNTFIRRGRISPTVVLVKYHRTIIAILHEDGCITVNTGEWQTSTTKTRLNALLPSGVGIYQEKYRWYIGVFTAPSDRKHVRYVDNLTIRPDKTVWNGSERLL